MNRAPRTMKPSQLRIALVASLIVLFVAAGALFGLAYTQLQNFGTEVAAKNGEAKASDNSLNNLKTTKTFLDANTALIAQTDAFVLARDLPLFQIRDDILHYAELYGLNTPQVSTSTGSSTGAAGGTGATTTPAAPATGAATPAAPATGTSQSGGKQLGVTVSFEGDVDYTSFVKFLYAIEHNLPKMTIDGINVTTSDKGGVTVAPFTINTYTK